MKIVIEGCDGVGKTSVCRGLSLKYDADIVHFTSEDPADEVFYSQTLRKKNFVYDRHCIGELVYPNVFDRRQQVNDRVVRDMIASNPDVHFFILTAENNVILNRIGKRSEKESQTVLDNIDYINSKFKTLATELNIPLIDTTGMSVDTVLWHIARLIEQEV